MTTTELVVPRGWRDCVVAASGPSLTPELAARCHGHHVIAVNRAWELIPWADVLYVGDRDLIELYQGFPDFPGEKWTAHEEKLNDKSSLARFAFHLVAGPRDIDAPGFSLHPQRIHYGNCSGFQAINLAILFGATKIRLIGFDMRTPPPGQRRHFHDDYPDPMMNQSTYEHFHGAFHEAARLLPPHIQIINCTAGSALRCFPMGLLEPATVTA